MFFGLPVGNNYSAISDDDLDFIIHDILQVRCEGWSLLYWPVLITYPSICDNKGVVTSIK